SVNDGDLGLRRQIVLAGIASSYEERVDSSYAGVDGIVKCGVVHSLGVQIFNATPCFHAQFLKGPELDRLGRTRVSTGRGKSRFLTVIAEGALEGTAIFFIALNYTERARDHAVRASVANVGLHVDRAELCTHNRASRTSFQASGILAVLADIRR